MFNELFTNAFIHAFPESREGVINIELFQNNIGTQGIIIEDSGIGTDSELGKADSDTLGFSLVSILAKQLKGDIHMENNSGMRFVITLPIK